MIDTRIWTPPPRSESIIETVEWSLDVGAWPIAITAIDDKREKDPSKRGKRPLGGEGWGAERHDLDWFMATLAKNPRANLGWKLGPESGVVDLDVDDVTRSRPVLERLFPNGLPTTLGWSNAEGKFHLLFAWTERLARFKTVVKGGDHYPGLELRLGSEGQQLQTVVPPSLLPNAARRRWNSHPTILPLPESILEDLERHFPPPRPRAPGKATDNGRASHVLPYVTAAIEKEVSAVAGAPEGTRNDQLNTSAYSLGQIVGAGQLGQADAVAALKAAGGAAGLGDGEITKTIASGLEAGKANPRDMSRVGTRATDGKVGANGTGHAREHGPQQGPRPGRPEIVITTQEHEVIDHAVAAIASDPIVYQRGNALVVVVRDQARRRNVTRPPGSPQIAMMPKARLRERMARAAAWQRPSKGDKNRWEFTPAHPPDWAVEGVMARGEWEDIRPLEGVVECPVLRPDGTILDVSGYDEPTGLLYEPNATFPPIPTDPTRDDADRAAGGLLAIVGDFPFAEIERDGRNDGGMAHRAAWLAALLTPIARFAIDGPCPLFAIDSNSPGAGKGLLAHIIAVVATGRRMAITTLAEKDDELRKAILSIALAGDRLMLLDNVPSTGAIGGSALDGALTASSIKDRILGKSKMSPEVPLYTIWYCTGNNLAIKGDALRRIVPCRLETAEERPEERSDFAIQGDLLAHVQAHRGRLVAAALTILRGYIVAGRPDPRLTPFGSYEQWSRVVRDAVHWAIGIDPCWTRKGLIATDPESLERAALIEGWAELPEGTTGMTVAAALRVLGDENFASKYEKLRDVLMDWSNRPGDLPSSRAIGVRLKAIKGRVCGKKTLKSTSYQGTQKWKVVDV